MAIIAEQISEDTILHYSDQNVKIRQIETGFLFDEAGDFIPCVYTYEETNIPVDPEPIEPEDIDGDLALQIIMGIVEDEEVEE